MKKSKGKFKKKSRNKWQRKDDNSKPMGTAAKSSSTREVCSNTILPQEIGKTE